MWLRACSERILVLVLAALAGCASGPPRVEPAAQPAAQAPPPAAAATERSATPAAGSATAAPVTGAAAAASGSLGPVPAPRPEVPAAARLDFDRAVSFMRAGNASEAELGFKQVALQYPQFAAPLVNLAILERKDGQLAEAEDALKSAVAREGGSALAWTELGATQRMRGEFTAAAASYEQAIAADAHYAPAWRNLGVVEDLYLGDPNRALQAFEQYKQLTGEEKPVTGWIAELRQRLGLAPAKRTGAPEPQAPGEAAPAQPEAAPEGTPPQETAPRAPDSPPAPTNAPADGSPPAAGG